MTRPRFADPTAACRTLTLVTAEDWPALRDSHPAKDWLIATGFEAGAAAPTRRRSTRNRSGRC